MAETIYTKKCPQCGGWYRVEENTNSGVFASCNRCGKIDDISFSRNEQNAFERKEIHEKGYGCIYIAKHNGCREEYLAVPVTQQMKDDFMAALNDPEVDKNESYFTVWDEDKQDVVAFYGNIPPVFIETA